MFLYEKLLLIRRSPATSARARHQRHFPGRSTGIEAGGEWCTEGTKVGRTRRPLGASRRGKKNCQTRSFRRDKTIGSIDNRADKPLARVLQGGAEAKITQGKLLDLQMKMNLESGARWLAAPLHSDPRAVQEGSASRRDRWLGSRARAASTSAQRQIRPVTARLSSWRLRSKSGCPLGNYRLYSVQSCQ